MIIFLQGHMAFMGKERLDRLAGTATISKGSTNGLS